MFPHFTTIDKDIYANILSSGKGLSPRTSNIVASTELFPFIRIMSGTGDGLILVANQNLANISEPIKDANGTIIPQKFSPSLYGNKDNSGILGTNWKDEAIFPHPTPATGNFVLRPSPVITDLEVKEGKDQISRTARVVVKCFSLGQVERLQEYLMEPGHSILIEYGWNTEKGQSQLIQTKNLKDNTPLSDDIISIDVAKSNLNADALQMKRIKSCGDYDSFFGFIVGGTMTSEGDTYVLTIELRGMPGLPSYLQLHENINELNVEKDKEGKITSKKVSSIPEAPLYTAMELNSDVNTVSNMGERRWKWMFNKLPATRQTFEVQKLVNTVGLADSPHGWWDLINFDYLINEEIVKFGTDDTLDTIKKFVGLEPEFIVGGVKIPPERLVTENRYIRFEKALEILNRNNGLFSYKIGDKKVNVRIATKSFIGAFPRIFSTKPSKLIIPGKIPDFQKYYLNTEVVPTNDIIDSEIDNSIMVSYNKAVGFDLGKTFVPYSPLGISPPFQTMAGSYPVISTITEKISFVQYSADGKGLRPAPVNANDSTKGNYLGYYETDGYYGELGNLYLNFGIFIDALKNSFNKSIREVLMDMLNEMSSAVNSFWNFQIVEGTDKNGDFILRIVDENWSGKNKNAVRKFVHVGEKSVFLDASLSIDIPSETTNQIILKRQDYISNPNAKNLTVGGIFSAKSDKFFKGVEYVKNQVAGGKKPDGTVKKTSADLKIEIDAFMNSFTNREFFEGAGNIVTVTVRDDKGDLVYTEKTDFIAGRFRTYENVNPNPNNSNGVLLANKITEYDQLLKDEAEASNTNLNANLGKIEVLPNPEQFIINTNAFKMEGQDGKQAFRQNFRIYCCDDTQLFDIIKNNAFESYNLSEVGATSHPLPIKYSFKILGRSGIRRGDIFNVYGIPQKYRDFGFFQTIQVDHTFSENKWTTEVSGQFRQQKQ